MNDGQRIFKAYAELPFGGDIPSRLAGVGINAEEAQPAFLFIRGEIERMNYPDHSTEILSAILVGVMVGKTMGKQHE